MPAPASDAAGRRWSKPLMTPTNWRGGTLGHPAALREHAEELDKTREVEMLRDLTSVRP